MLQVLDRVPTELWVAVSAGSLVLALASLALMPWLLVRLPANVLVLPPPSFRELLRQRPLVVALVLARNLAGLVLLLLGLAMLFLPGQGLLTILAGLALVDLPGRRRLLIALLRRPSISRAVSRLRARAGQPPLRLEGTLPEASRPDPPPDGLR